ncbi:MULTISPECIES: PP2C family protein-serine/threonine phosphatase [Streptomyces]|uniref:PP2C family protein-serine/threonine phosphatase n=1 Tax=Streptomyces luteosporeus TaxID=173856 RepID=A0ABN3TV12_9ACTN
MRLPHHLPALPEPPRPHRALLAVPLAFIVVITAADLLTGPDIHLGPLLAVAPAVAATLGGPRLTALVGALAVVAQIVIAAVFGTLTSANHEAQVGALLVVSLSVVGLSWMHERRGRLLDETRSVADVAQRVLLRPLPARMGPLRLAAVYVAAAAQARIGGDLYAAVRTTGGTRVMIGDVRGKGLTAVGDAALLLGAYRAAAHRNPPLPRLVAHLHNTVYWEPSGEQNGGEGFVTAVVVEIPDSPEELRMINCGHPPPLRIHRGEVSELAVREPALPLGLGASLTEDDFTTETFPCERGDVVLLYTDGVIETRSPDGAFYPLLERVAAWGEGDPQRLVRRIHEDLLVHSGGALRDDVAMVAFERCDEQGRRGPGTAPITRRLR